MADVAANSKGIVTTNGTFKGVKLVLAQHLRRCRGVLTRSACQGVGGTKDGTTSLHGVKTLPDHRNDGTASHVPDEAGEEWLVLEVSVVCARGARRAGR